MRGFFRSNSFFMLFVLFVFFGWYSWSPASFASHFSFVLDLFVSSSVGLPALVVVFVWGGFFVSDVLHGEVLPWLWSFVRRFLERR